MKTPREARVFIIHCTMPRRRESALNDQFFTDVDDSIHVIEKHFELVQLIKKQMSECLANVRILRSRTGIGHRGIDPDVIAQRVDDYLERYQELRQYTLPIAELEYNEALEEHKWDMYKGFANERWEE